MRYLILVAVLALAACGDNTRVAAKDDAGVVTDAPAIDAGIDAPPTALAPCLDRPTELPRPPSGQLPCELVPPGFVQP